MNCPDCLNHLTGVEFRGIRVEECTACHGRWFAREELTKAKNNVDEDLRWLDFDPFDRAAEQYAVPSEKKSCPHCRLTMDSLTYAGSGVVVNRCQQCRGVWVHHDEFEKIIQYLEDVIVSKPSPEYFGDSLKQFLEIAQGKDALAEELKDFLVVMKLSNLRTSAEHPRIVEAIKKIYEYLPFV